MTAQANRNTLPLSARLVRSLSGLALARHRRKAAARIACLDDHLLRDIGLHRIDVEAMRRMW